MPLIDMQHMTPIYDIQYNGEASKLSDAYDDDTQFVGGTGGKISVGAYDFHSIGAALEVGGGSHVGAPDYFADADFSRAYGYMGYRAGLMGSMSGFEATTTGGYRWDGGKNDHPYLGAEVAFTPLSMFLTNFGPVVGVQVDPIQVFSNSDRTDQGVTAYVGLKISSYAISEWGAGLLGM